MRKSLKTEFKQLSVALVSRIRLSNCFSISCVFDSILWEKSWRNRKSCEEKKNGYEDSMSCKDTYITPKQNTFHNPLNYLLTDWLFGKRWWWITVFLAHFRAWEAVSDLPPSRLPRTSWHCSAASLQESRVSPKSEHLSLSVHSCLGHSLLPPAAHSSSIRSLVVIKGINNS